MPRREDLRRENVAVNWMPSKRSLRNGWRKILRFFAITAALIQQRLTPLGYTGSRTILQEYVRKLRPQLAPKRAFVRMEPSAGERVEVDWAHFDALNYSGDIRKLYAFALVDAHSRMLYIEFTHSQSFETFVRCHIHAFHALHGVAREIVYDNLAMPSPNVTGASYVFCHAFSALLVSTDSSRKLATLPAAGRKGKWNAPSATSAKASGHCASLPICMMQTSKCGSGWPRNRSALQVFAFASTAQYRCVPLPSSQESRAGQDSHPTLARSDLLTAGHQSGDHRQSWCGKKFLTKVYGWKACQANKRVLFTTAMDMLNQLSASQVDHSLVRKLKAYTEPALLICD
ncbi:MAG: DDE-type integrase/transposase/recombinase [Bryobacteraceae bacterium]